MTELLFAIVLFAQAPATLTGRVSIAGIGIPAVEVRAINMDTGVQGASQTDAGGFYRIDNIQPGSYRLVLQKYGFKSIIKSALELHERDNYALNFSMELEPADESLTAG